MSIRCFFLRRKFVPCLEGDLPRGEAGSLDRHLARCRKCGELFQRVRSGHAAGRQFGRLGPGPACRPPEFDVVWKGSGLPVAGRVHPGGALGSVIRTLSSPLAVRLLLALVALQSVLLVLSNWDTIARLRAGLFASRTSPAFRGFTPLPIRGFPANSRRRVVTEGFVHNVYFDEEERTLHIKLVEIPKKPEPFVICEIRDFHGMTIPQEGNRIRVYGTARYDAQPGRGWHEVNPVMEIAVLKR